ncbi:hypothetical protein LUZ60_016922 [Juncus effusus]|nr:hypothetical protein LUZ60_016922 [Juncus effusus]
MGEAQEIQLHIRGHDPSQAQEATTNDNHTTSLPTPPARPLMLKRWRWWLAIFVSIFSLLSGQTTATLLGRFYFNEGAQSMWMATIIQSAGAVLLFPLLLLRNNRSTIDGPPFLKISTIYIILGVIIAGDNLMYSYGLLYLPVSTYSLVCATQLAFNAVFSYFINKQKFTMLIFNSVVLLTFSAALLGVNSDSGSSNIPKDKYPLGFVLTIAASATFSLLLSLMELTFQKVIKKHDLYAVLELQACSNLVATVITVVGLFVSSEWRAIKNEYDGYETGKASYVMTLVWTAVSWQVFSVGLISLIFVTSSLFANVISTLALPLVPVFAVVFFHDSMNGVKVVAMLIAVWGFLSYIYQHYLDDSKAKKKDKEDGRKDMNYENFAYHICDKGIRFLVLESRI